MNGWSRRFTLLPILCLLLLLLLLAGCDRDAGLCAQEISATLSAAADYAVDEELPFRFPMDDVSGVKGQSWTPFQASGMVTLSRREYHAAEDFLEKPGTPVYAMADGEVSFSGRMGGYGWLVIVDHPQANLYSLYGHLSPSRWQIEKGPVEKGTLLGYLGDDDENGGSAKEPLEPHLHLGLRAGQRADYSGAGEWRWMAGWITPCPTDLGWKKPSLIITGQQIPPGGFEEPAGGLLERWGIELLLLGIYVLVGIFALISAFRNDKPFTLVIFGAFMIVAGLVFNAKGFRVTPLLLSLAILFLGLGLFKIIGRRRKKDDAPGISAAS